MATCFTSGRGVWRGAVDRRNRFWAERFRLSIVCRPMQLRKKTLSLIACPLKRSISFRDTEQHSMLQNRGPLLRICQ